MQHKKSIYGIEIANRINERGRNVGTDYVATKRPIRRCGILFRGRDEQECIAWIEQQPDFVENGCIESKV